MIDLEKLEKDLEEWRVKVAEATKRCEELNKNPALNKMGGIGYHVQYARVICNPPIKSALEPILTKQEVVRLLSENSDGKHNKLLITEAGKIYDHMEKLTNKV